MEFTKKKIKKNFLPSFFLVLILLLGASLRLFKIREYMTFLGDEGRDVLVVKRMITEGRLTLLGPITSVGAMYMGPVYYYFMVPFLWLFRFDPVGPAIMVVCFSLATVFLLYKLGQEFFDFRVGLFASFLYVLSPLTIIYGRSSWNPNIVPFFSLLTIYSLLKAVVKKSYYWIPLIFFTLGIIIQLHYVSFLLFPVVFFSLFFLKSHSFKIYLLSVLAFLFSYSPFLLFEIRHQFVNFHSLWRFLIEQSGKNSWSLFSFLQTGLDVFIRLFWRLEILESAELTKFFLFFLFLGLIFYLREKKNPEKILAAKVIFLWLILGIFSFGFYQGPIYDYYFGALFPLPFIFTGIFLSFLWEKSRETKIVSFFLLLILTGISFKNTPFRLLPNNMLENTKKISRFVYGKTEGQPYNFALITERNSDHAYRYFLELWGHPPLTIENPEIDPERKTVTEQLLVVCEAKNCQPLGHPLWEIAGFGRAEIEGEWQVSTVKVFRLKHYQKN